jgi:Tfp pilus assembly PilM family ATPase
MFDLWKKHAHPIGVDITDDGLRMAQLREGGRSLVLVSGGSRSCPPDILPATAQWQKWAIEEMRTLSTRGKFSGRYVVASISPSDVFIDNIKVGRSDNRDFDETVLSKAKQKLPAEYEDAMVKYITAEEDNVIIIATTRVMVDRHLAIYEKAGLKIRSIGVWPMALTNAYIRFFGRRATDIETVVMLIDVGILRTNVVISRHKNLLFSRSVPIGIKLLQTGDMLNRLITELSGCRQSFNSTYKRAKIERMIFMSGQAVDRDVYTAIAKQLQLPAQIGDCLSAVKTAKNRNMDMERRNCQFSWATAFGLSLTQ